MAKTLPALVLLGLLIAGSVQGQTATWIHTIQASEYKPAKTQEGKEYLVYTYKDPRFNTTDWFDTWIEDWAENSGAWSDFAPAMDNDLKLFLYDVMYNNGFVTWKTYKFDLDVLVGRKLKFFQLKAK